MRAQMTFDYLRRVNVNRCVTPSPAGFNHPLDKWSIAEWMCAIAGEVGEACNIAKKILRIRDDLVQHTVKPNEGNLTYMQHRLVEELADAVIYADLVAASLGVDLGEAIRSKFNSKSEEIGSDIKL